MSTNLRENSTTEKNVTWIKGKTSMATKNLVKQRIDAFLNNNKGKFPNEQKEWDRMKTNYGKSKLTDIVELGIDKLKIKSFRKTANYRIVTNEHKIEFMEPWNPQQSNTLLDTVKEGWQVVGANKPKQNSTKTPVEKLHEFCMENLDNTAPTYSMEELCDTIGGQLSKFIVKHPKSERIKGEALDLTKAGAKTKAAENALAALKQSIQKTGTKDPIPLSQDAQTNDNASTKDRTNPTLNVVASDKDGRTDQDFMKLMRDNFKDMLFNTLASAKNEFKQTITLTIEEIGKQQNHRKIQRRLC